MVQEQTKLSVSSSGTNELQRRLIRLCRHERRAFQFPLAERTSCNSSNVALVEPRLGFQFPLAERTSCNSWRLTTCATPGASFSFL